MKTANYKSIKWLVLAWLILALLSVVMTGCGGDGGGGGGGAETGVVLAPIVEKPFVPITANDLQTEGEVIATENGYQSKGTLLMNTGGEVIRFENSDLQLEFDSEGNLIDLFGETDLPPTISENVAIDTAIHTQVGLYSGVEINQNEALGIILKEDSDYLVYYLEVGLDMTIGDRSGSGTFDSITLTPPFGGKVVLITDPKDVFYYYYGEQGLIGSAGRGESDKGRIPFEPLLSSPPLSKFDGHIIEKGAFSLGVKIFDFFEISGNRITHQPEFSEINWQDPLASEVEYLTGINGNADFALSILSVGLFSFPVAEASTTLEVSLDNQQMAMQTRVAPDVSWAPKWFPFLPTTEIDGQWMINGDGSYEARLSGAYRSTVPEADLAGSMVLNNEGVSLTGVIAGEMPLGVSAAFLNNVTDVAVAVPVEFSEAIKGQVSVALDDGIARRKQAYQDFVDATADYEYEFSLRGLKKDLPPICDTAIAFLSALPNTVASEAGSAASSYIQNYKVTVLGVTTYPLRSLSSGDKSSIINTVKGTAKSETQTAIEPYVNELQNLKVQSQKADSETFRVAIESALRKVYSNRTFSEKITVKYNFPLGIGNKTVYNKTITKTVLSPALAAQILLAADNVKYISESDKLVISAQHIFDQIPAEEIFQTVKDEVENGVRDIPTLEKMGYSVFGNQALAYAILGGERYDADFNVLNAKEALAGIGDIIAEAFIDSAEVK